MKVKRLVIKNIGLIADTTIELNKPLILFYGEIMQGKTTILNAVRWCFGGSYPEDIIRHGQKDASVLLEFEGGSINREWYKAKDGATKDRPISFIQNGKPFKGRVVDELKKLLNPFLLDQDYLRKMSELERSRYFVDLFGVDTSEIDKHISEAAEEAKKLRIKIGMYGDIDLTEIKPVDVQPLRVEVSLINQKYRQECKDVEEKNKFIRTHNLSVKQTDEDVKRYEKEIISLEKKIMELRKLMGDALDWFSINPMQEEKHSPSPPDTSSLETQISEAAATNVRAEQYHKNQARWKDKKADEIRLIDLETKQRELKKSKIATLKGISDGCKVKGLAFDETGNFTFEGTSAGMLSGSQIMRLSEELSNLYPKDLGIGLIDRAESLGKSVFQLIDRAKMEDKTILATVVGEKPAVIPEEVGVWIVENGEVINR